MENPRKIRYFKCKLQTTDDAQDSVSFKSDIYETMSIANSQHSPIKIRNFKRRANFRDNEKTDIEINKKTVVIAVPNAPFPFEEYAVPEADIKFIDTILNEG